MLNGTSKALEPCALVKNRSFDKAMVQVCTSSQYKEPIRKRGGLNRRDQVVGSVEICPLCS